MSASAAAPLPAAGNARDGFEPAYLPVNAVDALVVPDKALAAGQLVALPEATPRTLLDALPQEPLDDEVFRLRLALRHRVQAAAFEAHDITGHRYAGAFGLNQLPDQLPLVVESQNFFAITTSMAPARRPPRI